MVHCIRIVLAMVASSSFAAPTAAQTAFDAAPVADIALQAAAGREDIGMIAQSNSNATVTRNSVGENSRTGEVSVTDQAFQNLSGLSLLNINTGNNVAMNVNIAINPAP